MRTYLMIPALLVCVPLLHAQWSASASFLVGVPQGQFASNVGQNGYGVELTGAYAPPETPIRLGLNIGIMSYGQDSRREPFSTTIPDVTVEVSTSNTFVITDIEGRIQPNIGSIRPYLALVFGASILTTSTTITNESTGEEVASSTNQNDVAFNYGAGAGMNIRVWTNTEKEYSGSDFEVNDVSIHLGGTYVRGGEAEYLKKGSIRTVNGTAVYDLLKSRTDIILYTIGVSATF